MSAKSKADELAREILQSKEYKDLIMAKQIVQKNKDNVNKIKDLNSRQMELQKILTPDSGKLKAKTEEIKRYFDQINTVPELKEYFDAEKRFNDLIGETFNIINERIDSGLK